MNFYMRIGTTNTNILRQMVRDIERQRYRKIELQKDRDIERQRYRKKEIQKDRDIHRKIEM